MDFNKTFDEKINCDSIKGREKVDLQEEKGRKGGIKLIVILSLCKVKLFVLLLIIKLYVQSEVIYL